MTIPHVSIETITPQIAETYLSMNVENRPIRQSTVDSYAADMLAGHWRQTGEPIQFSGDRLLNGQHRLLACIKSQQPITVVVVRNVDPEAFEVMDSGVKRGLGDIISTSLHLPNSNNVAAAARMVMATLSGMTPNGGARQRISRVDVLAHVREHQEMYGFATRLTMRTASLRRSSLTAFIVLLLLNDANRDVIARFFERVESGENLRRGDARLALRMWTFKNTAPPAPHEELAVLIYAWNGWAKGAEQKMVKKLRQGDPMPKIERVHPFPHVLADL